jgi:hypothetical protein
MRDRAHENGLILGLVTKCLVRPAVMDCPLFYLEGLSLDVQINKIEGLSDAEIDEIVHHHEHCMEMHIRIAS